jgi:DNA-binding transcriptional regulator YiaG
MTYKAHVMQAVTRQQTTVNKGKTMDLPAQLRHWRAARGYTQAAAAARRGVPLRTYQNYESGHRQPRGLARRALTSAIQTSARKAKP